MHFLQQMLCRGFQQPAVEVLCRRPALKPFDTADLIDRLRNMTVCAWFSSHTSFAILTISTPIGNQKESVGCNLKATHISFMIWHKIWRLPDLALTLRLL